MRYKKLKSEDTEAKHDTFLPSHASLMSVLSFSWMSHIISEGNKRPLQEKDLIEEVCRIDEGSTRDDTELLHDSWQRKLKSFHQDNVQPQLWKCILKLIHFKDILLYVISLLLFSTTRVLQPIFLNYLLIEITDSDKDLTWAYWFGAGVVACSFAHLFAKATYYYTATVISTRIKSAVTGLTYTKVISI